MTNFKITAPEARRAAELVSMLRSRIGGSEWHKPGIEDALMRHADMADAPELVMAMIRASLEPVNRTPAIIGHPGPHWQQAQSPVRYPKATAAERCAVCSAPDGPTHPRDHEWVRPTMENQTRQGGKAAVIAEVKAELERGRERLCRHGGVVCKVCDPGREDPVPLVLEPATLPESEPVPVAP